MEGVFKISKNITKEEIENEMVLIPLSDYGDKMTISQFKEYNESGAIIDDDGYGELIYKNKIVENSIIWCFKRSVVINQKYIVSYDSLIKLFDNEVAIMWYNK